MVVPLATALPGSSQQHCYATITGTPKSENRDVPGGMRRVAAGSSKKAKMPLFQYFGGVCMNLCLHRNDTCHLIWPRASHGFARGRSAACIAFGRTWANKVSRARREQKMENGNGSRSCAKPARHLSQPRPQKQNTSHHLSGEWR